MSEPGGKQRVLIVEDEALVAMLLEDMLDEFGHEVAGVAGRLNDALEKARSLDFSCAVLDINLNGQRTYPIAEVLRARGIPFLFVSGYGAAGLEPGWEDAIVVQKPFQPQELLQAITRACRC